MHTGGAHVAVVAAPKAGIDAQENLPAAKHFRPHFQWIEIIQGDSDALGKAEFVFGTRREIGGEQDSLRVKCRHRGEGVLEFSARHAFQGESRGIDPAQDLGVPIRLHGIGPALDRAHREYRGNRRVQALHVVHEGCGLARRNIKQHAALLRLLPPIQIPGGLRLVAK